MSMVVPGNEVFTAIIAMLIEFFVVGLLAAYLTLVLPTEFGVRRPWHFPVTDPYRYLRRRRQGAAADTGPAAPGADDGDEVDDEEEDGALDAVRRAVLAKQSRARPY